MSKINADQQFSYQQAESGSYVKLNKDDLPALSAYPMNQYARLVYNVSDAGESGSIAENTSYQDTPFSNQVSVTTSAQAVTTNAKKGWVTLSIDPSSSDVVYIGASGVLSTTGFKLDAGYPMHTVSSDNLSEWYVVGASGGETLYVLGAYIN